MIRALADLQRISQFRIVHLVRRERIVIEVGILVPEALEPGHALLKAVDLGQGPFQRDPE